MNTIIIKLEDLVANAIIELNQSNGVNCVNMDSIMNYAEAVTDYFSQKKMTISSLIDCETYGIFRTDCEEYYEMDETANNNTLITLKNNKSIEDLKLAFRNYVKPEVLEAYISPEVLAVLGINQIKEVCSTLVLK